MELCNPCRDTIYGGTEFPAFVSYASPTTGAVSKAFPLPFKTALEGQGGGKRGGGHQLRSAIVCLRKRRRGSPPLPQPLPAHTSSLLLIHEPHNGVTSKISCAGLSQAGLPTPTLFSADTGYRRKTWEREGHGIQQKICFESTVVAIFFPTLSSHQVNLCTKGSPHPRLIECQAVQDGGVGKEQLRRCVQSVMSWCLRKRYVSITVTNHPYN